MISAKHENGWKSVRIVVPAYPRESIFTDVVTKLTALGPIKLASIISSVWGCRVEVIDENNYIGPLGEDNLPDHVALQKANLADVVAIYGAMSCTIEEVWKIAKIYHKLGCLVISGGWHAKDNPQETLSHDVDAVFFGKEGAAISDPVREFFEAIVAGRPWTQIKGIYYLDKGIIVRNNLQKSEVVRGYDRSLDQQPFANFIFLKHARKIKIFTVRRTVGCKEGCEFCRVCEPPRWASPVHFCREIDWLVQHFGAEKFFRTDDNSGEDRAGELEVWRTIKVKYGNRLKFGVQVRADIAEDDELIEAMAGAGVTELYIGLESPIDEELEAMGKGYRCADMERWVLKLRKRFRHIHEMFIANYPLQGIKNNLSAEEIAKRIKAFIRRTKPDSIQVTLPGPLPKTAFRKRMEKAGRVLPLDVAPWNYYDGTLALILPDNMSFEEFQDIPMKIMKWFYNRSYFRIIWRLQASVLEFFAGKWEKMRRSWRREAIRHLGATIVLKWQHRKDKEVLFKRVKKYLSSKLS